MKRYLLTLLLTFSLRLAAEDAYSVKIEGSADKRLLNAFKESSVTYGSQNKKLHSLQTLKRRGETDIEKFEEIAEANGHYSASARFEIRHTTPPEVIFHLESGPKYILDFFEVHTEEGIETIKDPLLQVGQPIDSQSIIDAEKAIIWKLKKQGYATCFAGQKIVIADASKHTLSVTLQLQKGPKYTFGQLDIQGNTSVKPQVITKRLFWKEGDCYDPEKIQKTATALEKTGLFSSVTITEDVNSAKGDQLPLHLQLQESKHKSVGAGVAYTTTFGAGVRAEWENRNFRGLGDKLQLRTEFWQKYQTMLVSLSQPDFSVRDQTLIWLAEYDKLRTVAFESVSYNGSALVQRRLNRETEIGFGGRLEWLSSRNFEGHHIYYLTKAPLQFKWSNADTLLDPTRGETLNVKMTPTAQLIVPRFCYTWQTTSLSSYHSLPGNWLTIAARIVCGNIIGAARHTIPPPDRFYGGSENILRGYRAYSVSPLHDRKTPIGGRSLLAASLEARFRTGKELGFALFYDIGNVYSTNVPDPRGRQLSSVGTGVRYNTPIGPLRFDIAVPLHRRKELDPFFQIYFSIGQSF